MASIFRGVVLPMAVRTSVFAVASVFPMAFVAWNSTVAMAVPMPMMSMLQFRSYFRFLVDVLVHKICHVVRADVFQFSHPDASLDGRDDFGKLVHIADAV